MKAFSLRQPVSSTMVCVTCYRHLLFVAGMSACFAQEPPPDFAGKATRFFFKRRAARCATIPTAWPPLPGCVSRRKAPPARIDAFGKSLVELVDRQHPEQSLLFNKPTIRIKHTGGERVKKGSPEEALLTWITYLAAFTVEVQQALAYRKAESQGGPTVYGRAAAADSPAVRQHGARSVEGILRRRESISSRRFRQRFQESIPVAVAVARRRSRPTA